MNSKQPIPGFNELRSPEVVLGPLQVLKERKRAYQSEVALLNKKIEALQEELDLAPKVHDALEHLSAQMFDELLEGIGKELSLALRAVMHQDIDLRANVDVRRREGMRVEFWIERDGCKEDLLRGQGGSVVNVLSVGMRLFALSELDQSLHRPTLFLDEPDAWLSPDLVPRLMRVITLAASDLGFQVVVISHHDIGLLQEGVNKIIQFSPNADGTVSTNVIYDDGSSFGEVEEVPSAQEVQWANEKKGEEDGVPSLFTLPLDLE